MNDRQTTWLILATVSVEAFQPSGLHDVESIKF